MSEQDSEAARALRLARRWYPSAREVTGEFEDGLRHRVFEIDRRLVVKLPRDGTPPDELLREEFVLREIGRLSDLQAPRVLGFDSEARCLCLTRITGSSLLEQPQPWPEKALRHIGRVLARLHALPTPPFLASPLVETVDIESYWRNGLRFLRSEGLVTEVQYVRLEALLGETQALLAAAPHVLLNADVWPHHCYVDPGAGTLTGIIDFADARVGPAAWEFASRWYRPEGAQDLVVDEYTSVRGLRADHFRSQIEAMRLVKAVWVPGWARERGLGTRGWRFYLAEIERQLSRQEML